MATIAEAVHDLLKANEALQGREDEAKAIVQEWMNQQGHNRCHYYPELFKKLADLYGIKQTVDSCLPLREEFEAGCRKYQEEEYGPKS